MRIGTDTGEDGGAVRLPPVIGHRGAAGCAPENTLAGLRRAKTLDCAWVEFDVRLTADNRVILLHDHRLHRTTDGRGRADALTLGTIRQYRAKSRFGSTFAGEPVPTLEEAIAVLAELGLGANVELKAVRGRHVETGVAVARLLTRMWPADLPGLLISSFRAEALAAARDCAAHICRGVLFGRLPRHWRQQAEELGATTIHVDHRWLRPTVVAELRRCGYPLLAYTVNDPVRAMRLFSWGVTSVFSDVPHIILAAINGSQPGSVATRPAEPSCQGADPR